MRGTAIDGGSARKETLTRPARGHGHAVGARCDECQVSTFQPRKRAKVLSGALRGMAGMVCVRCLDGRCEK